MARRWKTKPKKKPANEVQPPLEGFEHHVTGDTPPPAPVETVAGDSAAQLAPAPAAAPVPVSAPEPAPEPVPEVVHAPPVPPALITALEAEHIRRLLAERARRSVEGLRLYEPLPDQHRFHVSLAPERLIRGSNRAGKTLGAAVEVARAVTGQDPFDKYPRTDGRAFLIGKDGKHVAQVMWRKLSRAGAFKIIRDARTRRWRAYRPWDAADCARAKEAKPAPPLIPPRLVKTVAWENKKEGLPSLVVLQNGWELNFFSSLGKPPNGNDVDLCWFDEEIVDPEWYPEMSARLLDRAGRFVWSATPQAGTEQLYALHERAEEQRGLDAPQVAEFLVLLSNNPHVPADQKAAFAAKLSEQDYQVRIEGDFALMSFKVFPEFTVDRHVTPFFEVPRHWTRYAVVDPGRQVCAVLFAAVPPPEHGEHLYVYDELYVRNCDAEQFGQGMREKCSGQSFQAFLIDHHGGRMHDAGAGRTIEQQYAEALKRHKVQSLTTGHHFAWGNDDVRAGVEAVRTLLRPAGESAKPKLLVVGDRCPNLLWEFRHYRYKRVAKQVTEKPEDRGRVHLMATLRYLALYPTRFVPPAKGRGHETGALRAYRDKQRRQRQAQGGGYVRLGPGRPH